MKKNIFYLIMMLFLFVACGGSNDNTFTPESMGNNNDTLEESNSQSAWLIPISEVKDGGPGKDGIPSIDSSKFVNVSDSFSC